MKGGYVQPRVLEKQRLFKRTLKLHQVIAIVSWA